MRESSAWSCRWTTRTCGRSAWRVPCVSSGCSVQVTNSNSDFKICRFVPTRRYDTRTQIRNFFFFFLNPKPVRAKDDSRHFPFPFLFSASSSQPLVLASLPCPSPLIPSLPVLLASLHSLLLHLRQVAQCAVPCPFLADIACHYVSLCRSLIPLLPPSLLFPSTTGEST